ncbi:DUF4349 domain-containing protein [Metabacillus herbersteinensis]|uniref:DUF4349 domain-containing protein n=1 Tax=Metabacillus herbersteinensis TaxID=283816 RepID=A0ABV6GAR4_9BACI
MKRLLQIFGVLLVCSIVTACSGGQSESESSSIESADMAVDSGGGEEAKTEMSSENSAVDTSKVVEKSAESQQISTQSQSADTRKVIYNANLSVEVENYQETSNEITQQIQSKGGYIVQSNTFRSSEEGPLEGTLVVRIPQAEFNAFLESVEKGSMKVHERSISGQDVTEEFVDLESRLKSKEVVEKRLITFMEKAEKTEDLLKISEDLSKVQEEIEQIRGRMNFLQNQSNLATVTIHVFENKVNVPQLQKDELNTWEKTKKQFMESVNFVVSAFSTIIIFFVGSLPILLILGGVGLFLYLVIKRMNKRNNLKPPTDMGE